MNRRRNRPRIPISHRGGKTTVIKCVRVRPLEQRERVAPEKRRQ
jgi:hypothetical protein